MHYVLAIFALIFALWVGGPYLYRLFGKKDYAAIASRLDPDGAHAMLEKHIRQMALSVALPEHFRSGRRDADAAAAAMTRILELEGEYRPPDEVREFVVALAQRRAETMTKDDQYPIVFDDMWSL
jgi:hypothetical protein